jgi:hypothetical protein
MRQFMLLFIGLFFGIGIGFVTALSSGAELEGHAHGEDGHEMADGMAHDHGGHDHSTLLENGEGPAPTIDIALIKDTAAGWNLHVMTENFVFAPRSVNQEHVPNSGHAHVYVNGKKLARLYGPWMHIGELPNGEVTVSVSLNANTHSPLAVDGVPVEAAKTITVE